MTIITKQVNAPPIIQPVLRCLAIIQVNGTPLAIIQVNGTPGSGTPGRVLMHTPKYSLCMFGGKYLFTGVVRNHTELSPSSNIIYIPSNVNDVTTSFSFLPWG